MTNAGARDGHALVSSISARLLQVHSGLPFDPIVAYHEATATFHELAATARGLELAGWAPEEIRTALASARELLSTSVFIDRLQRWPRGYQGDFETIEYLLDNINRTEPHTWGHYFERAALATAAAEQHRDKVRIQARFIKDRIERDAAARVLLLACGSCPDLFSIKSSLHVFRGEFVINDQDREALAFSVKRLAPCQVTPIEGNVVKVSKRLLKAGRKFDVIVAGGLFDYLSSRVAGALLADIWDLLEPGGSALFTNIGKGNPFRTWMEYCADWTIIERGVPEIKETCVLAGIPVDSLTIVPDQTQLTWLVTLAKPESRSTGDS